MSGWLIVNARWLSDGTENEGDLRIRGSRIDEIGRQLSIRHRETLLEARGRYLLPGMIDSEVHFREPGLTHKGDLASESRAAVAGGVTSILDYPDCRPATLRPIDLADKSSRATDRSTVNFSFFIGAAGDRLSVLGELPPGLSCGVHATVATHETTYGLDQPEQLTELSRSTPLPIVFTPPPRVNPDRGGGLAGLSEPWQQACREAGGLLLGGLATRADLKALAQLCQGERPCLGAVTLPHLYFIDADRSALGGLVEVEPPLAGELDRRALRRAVRDGDIVLIGSAHAPHLLREKMAPATRVPSGASLIQHVLPAAWSLVAARVLSPATLVEVLAHNPARRFAVRERGFLREGYFADLVLFDQHKRTVVDQQANLTRCGWNAFQGRKLPGQVCATWVNGRLVWRDGLLTGIMPGKRLDLDHLPN